MAKIHTHYDNLRVARNAPASVMKAAYRALSQEYHPDKRPGDADATRVMALVNTAYAVLSDPQRRREHDAWIEGAESAAAPQVDPRAANATPTTKHESSQHRPQNEPREMAHGLRRRPSPAVIVLLALILGSLLGLNIWVSSKRSGQPRETDQVTDYRPETAAPSVKPADSGNDRISFDDRPPGWVATDGGPVSPPAGKSWPKVAGYLPGVPRSGDAGLSSIAVDNRVGGFNAYVKLCPVRLGACKAIRSAYIPMGQQFTMSNLKPGNYEIRYQDVATRSTAASPAISLNEVRNEKGTKFSKVELTLYRVEGGNMIFTPIPADQF